MLKRNKAKRGKSLAISQVISLILSTIAFAYILGSAFPIVSAQLEHCVSIYNSGGTKIVSVPTGTSVTNFCKGKGTQCKEVQCPSPQPTTPPAAINPVSVLTTVVHPPITVRGATPQPVQAQQPPAAQAAGISVGYVIKTAGWAALIYTSSRFILGLLHASPQLANALSSGLSVGYFIATISGKIGLSAKVGSLIGISTGLATFFIGAFVAIAIFLIFGGLTKHRVDLYQFTCYPWDAPLGGKDCVKCNQGDLPCTEYRCNSLGQGCELENQGTGQELCVWKNRNDVKPPVIKPWLETLTTGYKYVPDNSISPPDNGVRIVPENNNSGCIAAFTPLTFGVMLDKPARCKIDTVNKKNFSDMDFYFGGSSTSKYNHSQTMSLPSPDALATENITLENNGEFSLYTRCQDTNGNENTANFVFRFCVDKGPDTTPPQIVTTSIINGSPISFNTTSVDLQVYVNEPAECKWSKTDQSYDNMENQMSCNTNVLEMNAQSLYKCSTTLNGLSNGVNNNFYFRCKDQPFLQGTSKSSQRNANSQSYKYTLVGTRPLVIDSVGPNGTISDSTNIIKVTLQANTSAGYNEGAAICSYRGFGTNDQFNEFLNTGTYQHSQDLFLPEGDYTFDIQCVDLGGNTDNKQTSFTVVSDTQAPVVVRAFKEENFLKIITNEKASCVYSTSTQTACNYLFGDGIAMQSLEKNTYQTDWNPDMTFYIKCKDDFGNQPLPNECSIIARPFGK
jgi:hypothetical protein